MTDEEYVRYGLKLSDDTLLILIPASTELFTGNIMTENRKCTDELKEWCAINTPSAQFTTRNGLDLKNIYGCFTFATEKEFIAFKLRWWPVGGT